MQIKILNFTDIDTKYIDHLYYNFSIKGLSRACYSDDTEVLTDKGFKLFEDLNKDDLIATRNKNGEVEFQEPTDYIKYHYKGIMHQYNNQVIDCLVTPNHRMMYKKNNVRVNKDNIYYTKSEEINVDRIKFLKTMNFKHHSKIDEIFTIPSTLFIRKSKIGSYFKVNKEDLKINKNAFLKLLAMYISKGSTYYDKKNNKYFISIHKSNKLELIKSILEECGFYNYYFNIRNNRKCDIKFISRHLGVYFKKLGTSYEKYIPINPYDFSKEDARLFLDTYSQFNGSKKKDTEIYTLTTTSKKLREQLELLVLIAGYSLTTNVTDRRGRKIIINGNKATINHITYNISYSKRAYRNVESTIKISKHRKTINYNGFVYCVSVPNGNLFVRRNNKTMWCGNCLQELARHRMASLSVRSSRYTLRELRDEEPFTEIDIARAEKYIVLTNDIVVDRMSILALENLRQLIATNTSNDIAKYSLPECYKTDLLWSINARSLINFLTLRTSKAALWEIRNLANEIFKAIPEKHKFLFEKYIQNN